MFELCYILLFSFSIIIRKFLLSTIQQKETIIDNNKR